MNSNKSVVVLNVPAPECLAFFPSKSKERNTWGFTRNCHPEFISGSTPLVIIQNKEEMLKQVQHDNRRGFTLIELLVVVLIIGILAAVAVPQYQKAVWKSEFVKYRAWLRSIYEQERVYYLDHGTYTADLRELNIDLPEGTEVSTSLPSKIVHTFPDGMQISIGKSLFQAQINYQEVNFEMLPSTGNIACFHNHDDQKYEVCRIMGCKEKGNNNNCSIGKAG